MRSGWLVTLGFLFLLSDWTSGAPGYRLPGNILPEHYILEIITHLGDPDFSFAGNVWIKIRCIKPTNSVILHSNKLNITDDDVTLKEIENNEHVLRHSITSAKHVPENEFYILKLNETLKSGKEYILHIPFTAQLNEDLAGFYRSSYIDKATNETRWLAVTQFESTDARRAFPCFDEPAMKAGFSIKIGHQEGLKAISNMPLKKVTPIENMKGWVWEEFEDTVPMSTYLVAFMVSEFEHRVSPPTSNNVTFRIWARKDAIDQVELARELGPRILAYYEDYFDVKYPLPKQDMAAIPDFSAGAMENWGLITYREIALLFDKSQSSSVNQHSIASVVAHELAHQWFGNLVTMKWWTDLWLNEGFATYVASLGVNKQFPEWNSLDSTSLDHIQLVYTLDALKSSHPVSVKIGNPSEITQIFDIISYKKGSAILRMMHNFLGKSFERGVSNYLKEYRYRNAEQDDLWLHLTNQAHKDGTLDEDLSIKEIMDTWTLQTGYPLVSVVRDYEMGTAKVTQKRYLQVPPEGKEAVNETCWWVPLTYTTKAERNFADAKPKKWLNCADQMSTVITGLPAKDQWVMFNINGTALYRVQYDIENWRLISETLNSDEFMTISPLNRAITVINALDLAWRGDLDYQTALQVVGYLRRETDYLPWKAGLTSLNDIDRMLKRTSNYGHFKKFIQELVEPAYKRYNQLARLPTQFESIKMHSMLSRWACRFQVGDCLDQVNSLFKQWRDLPDPDSKNPIPNDMKSVVYCNAIRYGNEDAWDFMWERYLKTNVGTEKNAILSALGCSRDVWILTRYLENSFNESSGIRKQDSFSVFASVARQEVGYFIACDYLMKNIKSIYEYFGDRTSRPGRYLSVCADNMMLENEVQVFKSFVNSNKEYLKYSRLAADQSIETAVANSRWFARNYGSITRTLVL